MRQRVKAVRNKRIGENSPCLTTAGAREFCMARGEVTHPIGPDPVFHAGYAAASRNCCLASSRAVSPWLEGHFRRTSLAAAPRFATISPEGSSCSH